MPDIKWQDWDESPITPHGNVPEELRDKKVRLPRHLSIQPIRFQNTSYRHFKLEHANLHDKVVLHFYTALPVKTFQDALQRYLHNNLYPPEIDYVPEVRSHSVIYKGEIPNIVLRWINQKVQALDESFPR